MNKPDLEKVVVARITLQHYESLLSSQWKGSHRHTHALWVFRRLSAVSIEKLCGSCLDTLCSFKDCEHHKESSMKDLQRRLYTMAD